MRRLPAPSLLAVAALAVVALAACSSGAAPGWTYAPAPSVTPVPSGSASASPSGEPSASAPASPSATASGSAGPVVTVVASTALHWDTPTLQVAADTPFTLEFDNKDATAPHNVVIMNPDSSKVPMEGDTSFFTGPAVRTYQVPGLAAGTYKFICEVHPTSMVGDLTAG